MESRIKLFGHAIHPMLIVFPLGLLVTATFFDVAGMISGYSNWHQAAFWMIGTGTIIGIVAAITGTIDWIAIPLGTRAKSIGLLHGLINMAMLTLFAIAWLMRQSAPSLFDPGWMPIALEIIALGMAGCAAWLGGELIERLGVGIDTGAHLNAPSSLSGRLATDTQESPLPTRRPIKTRA